MFTYHLCKAHHGTTLCVFFTLDLSEALDKLVFYDCLLSVLLKVVVLWIYKFDIQACKLYLTSLRWPVHYILKGVS